MLKLKPHFPSVIWLPQPNTSSPCSASTAAEESFHSWNNLSVNQVQTSVLIRPAWGAKHHLPPDTAQQWENSLPKEASLDWDAGKNPNPSFPIPSLCWKTLQVSLKFSSGQNFLSSRAQCKLCTKTQTFFFCSPSGMFPLFFFFLRAHPSKHRQS